MLQDKTKKAKCIYLLNSTFDLSTMPTHADDHILDTLDSQGSDAEGEVTEALCSLVARFDLEEDDVDIKALKEVATELRETLIPSVMACWPLLQRA